MMHLMRVSGLPVDQVGGKAHRLNRLVSLGCRVKPAVVLTVSDVDRVLADERVAERMAEEVVSVMGGEAHEFAVRSSAVGEDGVLAWAGQFATSLFVPVSNLAVSIVECARAVKSAAVTAYAEQHHLPVPKLALVVQEMVPASYAGVIFTADPMGAKDRMVIEVISGVGEALVSGRREPRRYHVDGESGRVVGVTGATEPELAPSHIDELWRIGLRLKRDFAGDQDVEWAIEKGSDELFLLQARDITVVPDDPEQIRERVLIDLGRDLEDERRRLHRICGVHFEDVLSDQNIVEILTRHPCQMAFGLFTYGFAHGGGICLGRNEMGYQIGDELRDGFFRLVAGQPRCSIVHDAMTYRVQGIPLEDYIKIIGYYLDRIREDESRANYPEIGLYVQRPSLEFLHTLFEDDRARVYHGCYERFYAGFQRIETTLAVECRTEFLPRWRERMSQAWQRMDGTVLGLSSLYHEVCELLRTEACRIFVKSARVGFFAFARLRELLTELYGDEGAAYLNVLSGGAPLDLNPNLRFGIQLAALRDGMASIEEVMAEFGHLAINEMEVSVPRYREQPEALMRVAQRTVGNPEDGYRESAARSRELAERLLYEASEADRLRLAYELKTVQTYLPLREVVKFEFLRAHDLLRECAIRMGKVLGWEDDLIFHLDPREVFTIGDRAAELHALACTRRQEWRQHRQLHVPQVVWSRSLEVIGIPDKIDGRQVLKGVGVTNYIAEGMVVVIREMDDAEGVGLLVPGSILVTVTTDPAWTPLLSVIGPQGGLITEVGGLLAHAAVYARETGLAAVLNIPNATALLKTGMRVRVNGPLGQVEILS